MVEYIEYEGIKYPIRVSYYALMMTQKETGNNNIDDFEAQKHLLWYALEAGHKVTKEELKLKKDDMVWVLDICYTDFQKALFSFTQQMVEAQKASTETKKK